MLGNHITLCMLGTHITLGILGTHIVVGVLVGLHGFDPGHHGLGALVLRLEEVLGAVEGDEAEDVLLLGVVVSDVHAAGFDGDGMLIQ